MSLCVCVCVLVQAESYLMVVDHADRQAAGDKTAEDEKGQGEPLNAIVALTLHIYIHVHVCMASLVDYCTTGLTNGLSTRLSTGLSTVH